MSCCRAYCSSPVTPPTSCVRYGAACRSDHNGLFAYMSLLPDPVIPPCILPCQMHVLLLEEACTEQQRTLLGQETATALGELTSLVDRAACESSIVRTIVALSKDRVWAVRVAVAAALPSVAAGAEPATRAGVPSDVSGYQCSDRSTQIQSLG